VAASVLVPRRRRAPRRQVKHPTIILILPVGGNIIFCSVEKQVEGLVKASIGHPQRANVNDVDHFF
jgi:hypothetical protein